MSKIAFIFPGQGSQYVGMGKDFCEKFSEASEVYDIASKSVDLDIKSLCFEENTNINITEYTQIAMLTTEVALLKVLINAGIKADVCAGLSLGEYAALVAADVLSLEDCFKLVRRRGILMQEAYPEGGAMCAILGMDSSVIEDKCAKVAEETGKYVSIANYNCPGQIIITGEEESVDKAAECLKEAGAKRCMRLNVSGPFHSELIKDAGYKLGEELDKVKINKPSIPYVCNVNAEYVCDDEKIKQLLINQVFSSVKWQQSVEYMIKDGVDTFIEIGPGKTLSNFIKRIDPTVKVVNMQTVEDYEELLKVTEVFK